MLSCTKENNDSHKIMKTLWDDQEISINSNTTDEQQFVCMEQEVSTFLSIRFIHSVHVIVCQEILIHCIMYTCVRRIITIYRQCTIEHLIYRTIQQQLSITTSEKCLQTADKCDEN